MIENKTIHYIWLGGKKKPRVIQKCILSWKKYMPGWKIKEWNETNLDINICEYCKEAYEAHRYAFAADVLRFYILYNEGGLYFDTDVKLLKSLEPLAQEYEAFTGYEYTRLNPGLVLYAKHKRNKIFAEMLEQYYSNHYIIDGKENQKVVGEYLSEILEKYGFKYCDILQQCSDFTVFPSTYFCPTDAFGNKINFSENTYSVHLFAASWMPVKARFLRGIKKFLYRHIGVNTIQKIMQMIRRNGKG